jgi:hypothetical protein
MPASKYLSSLYKHSYKDTSTALEEVVRAVEVLMDGEHYRIEVVRAHDERQIFSARCRVLKDVPLQPTYPSGGRESRSQKVWRSL